MKEQILELHLEWIISCMAIGTFLLLEIWT